LLRYLNQLPSKMKQSVDGKALKDGSTWGKEYATKDRRFMEGEEE